MDFRRAVAAVEWLSTHLPSAVKLPMTEDITQLCLERRVSASGNLVPLHAMKARMGSGGIALVIHNPGTRLRWVISFTPSSALPLGKVSPETHWNSKLDGPQSRFGHPGGDMNLLRLSETGTRLQPENAPILITWSVLVLLVSMTLLRNKGQDVA
jgi:hypothetical protein